MDFYRIKERTAKNGVIEVYPDFRVTRSEDLMVRGGSVYGIWDEDKGLWSTDEYDVQRLVDADLTKHADVIRSRNEQVILSVKYMGDFSSNTWLQFRNYVRNLSDSSHQLDENLTFSNSDVSKKDFVSRRLPYPLAEGSIAAWDELISTLYDPEDRAKIEWAIGAVVSGDAKNIQKFLVFYGAAGTGKSTVLNIIQKLFEGYYTTFEAKALTSSSNAFSTEVFKANPLVAIQHDGDLSRIEDNTKLNSIVSHEDMTMNEKYKPSYMAKINAFLFMGTNKPVKITDAKSGIIRRLIDVQPSGRKLAPVRYQTIMSQIDFELGAIAHYCVSVYREMGKHYYNGYKPVEMMLQTDVFYNFIEQHMDMFRDQDGVTLEQAYSLYKIFCDEALVEFKLARHKFREELKNYFNHFEERALIDGIRVRSWYSGFQLDQFKVQIKEEPQLPLLLEETESIFDKMCAERPAQYATQNETPSAKWAEVTTTLHDLNTRRLHYVKPPENHIVIDFDLKDETGQKSAQRNLEAAAKWPATYAEYSKGGGGIHLHYNYAGDVSLLGSIFEDGIEVKVFRGDASLRRKLTKCNNIPVATLNSGLPLKEKKVINVETVRSEKSIRDMIERNLKKEIHGATRPSIDFIHHILEEAYAGGSNYDVSDLRTKITAFANKSSNQAMYCLKKVMDMKFKSAEVEAVEDEENKAVEVARNKEPIVFYDVEVFQNLFVICWKYQGVDQVNTMVNPSPHAVADFMKMKLVGFNVRKYDNHIVYAASMGYSVEQLYKLSQRIINNERNAMFGEAYELSYADIFDFSSIKQSLKKFQVDLGLMHKELGLPWDQPVPDNMVEKVVEYCCNDVITTEQVFDNRHGDFQARQILADISGLSVNATTAKHTQKIIFGNDRRARDLFEYTDLSTMFPGYSHGPVKGGYESVYKDEVVGEGGYVYAEPGIYHDVALLDVASMHPTSIEQLNLFGPYTKNFSALKNARLAIKRGEFDFARKLLDGKLAPYLEKEEDAEALSYALKIVINIVYGLTAATFDSPFRDPRNKDNIVAKRGALFMVDLKHAVQEQGYTVIHIKTDSIKIANADKDIIDFVMEFGTEYGYQFEHEATYDKIALVNEAVYVAKTKGGRKPAYWDAVGAQYQHPYVFKKLFSKEDVVFRDLCEAKSTTTALYLDFEAETEEDSVSMAMAEHKPIFVGKTGLFCPIAPGKGGGLLLRVDKNDPQKFSAATGTKGYRWKEAHVVEEEGLQNDIDKAYFTKLVDDAVAKLQKYDNFDESFFD